MLVVGPEVPEALRPTLMSVVEAIRALQMPGAPVQACRLTAAELPPAASYTDCVVYVSDLSTFAVSNGSGWVRQDTKAVI